MSKLHSKLVTALFSLVLAAPLLMGAEEPSDARLESSLYQQYFAMIAVREGSSTTFILHNPGESAANSEIELRRSDGSLIERREVQVPGGAMRRVKFGGEEGSLAPGWARLISDQPLMTSELLQTGPTPWVSVLPSLPATRFRLFGLVGRPDGLRTGIAFANPSDSRQANVTVRLLDSEGKEFRRQELAMKPLTHSSGCLDDLFTGLGRFEGTAEFLSDLPLIAMSVRSDKDMLTLLPVVSLSEDGAAKQWTPNQINSQPAKEK